MFTNSALRVALLDNLLTTLDHVLAEHLVSIATELCTLYLVLCRKWSHDIDGSQSNKALSLVSRFLLSMPSELATPLYAITLHALQWARHNSSEHTLTFLTSLTPSHPHRVSGVSLLCSINTCYSSYSGWVWSAPTRTSECVMSECVMCDYAP